METIPLGLCQCGCGATTNLVRDTNIRMGHTKGEPRRFLSGHYAKTKSCKSPYRKVRTRLVHVVIVEAVLGHPLPAGAQVHHVDGDKHNNAHCNLVVCQDQAYHQLLHLRQKSLAACGDPDMRRCVFCRKWDKTKNLRSDKWSRCAHHLTCRSAYYREWARKRRGRDK